MSRKEEDNVMTWASNQKMSKDPQHPPENFSDDKWNEVRDTLWCLGEQFREDKEDKLHWVYQVS